MPYKSLEALTTNTNATKHNMCMHPILLAVSFINNCISFYKYHKWLTLTQCIIYIFLFVLSTLVAPLEINHHCFPLGILIITHCACLSASACSHFRRLSAAYWAKPNNKISATNIERECGQFGAFGLNCDWNHVCVCVWHWQLNCLSQPIESAWSENGMANIN